MTETDKNSGSPLQEITDYLASTGMTKMLQQFVDQQTMISNNIKHLAENQQHMVEIIVNEIKKIK